MAVAIHETLRVDPGVLDGLSLGWMEQKFQAFGRALIGAAPDHSPQPAQLYFINDTEFQDFGVEVRLETSAPLPSIWKVGGDRGHEQYFPIVNTAAELSRPVFVLQRAVLK